MIRQRLINCDFLNASTFLKLSNKAKLLYLLMITNADDLGFVGNTHTLIKDLTSNDDEINQVNLELLKNDYVSALVELINKTYIYRFVDKHNNEIFVIKHWFMHNRWRAGLRTNYFTFYSQLELENGEYFIKEKKPLKENKINHNNINQNKVNQSSENNEEKENWDKIMNELDELDNQDNEDMRGE